MSHIYSTSHHQNLGAKMKLNALKTSDIWPADLVALTIQAP